MKEWVLSIAGVIVFGVLLDVVLPQGKTAKYLKGIFAILVVYVIVAPLPKALGKAEKWVENFDESSFEFSFSNGGDFWQNSENLSDISEKTEKMLENNGISGAIVLPRYDEFGKVLYVNVDFSAVPENLKTKQNFEKAKLIVANYFEIKTEEVRILGTN